MKRIYLTAIPLESNIRRLVSSPAEPVNFTLTDRGPRRFPIVRIIGQTMEPGDQAVVVTVRQRNEEKNQNLEDFRQELAALGLPQVEVKDLVLEESQSRDQITGLFLSLMDCIQEEACYYACITFGTKTWPLVLFSVFHYIEKTMPGSEIRGIYYQEALRKDGQIVQQRLYDMSVLMTLNNVVDLVASSGSGDAARTIRQLLEGC